MPLGMVGLGIAGRLPEQKEPAHQDLCSRRPARKVELNHSVARQLQV